MFKLETIKFNKDFFMMGLALVAIAITIFLFVNNGSSTAKSIAQKSVDYLNKSILKDSGQTASLTGYSEESGVIKINIKVGANTFESYATRDGKLLFPQALSMDSTKPTPPPPPTSQNTNPQKQNPNNLAKVDSPLLEAYVVSRCPFGLQMMRAMDNAIANAPALANYIKIRYIGSLVNGDGTSMHGQEEWKQNLREICIREEQPDKFWPYIACDMRQTGQETSCLTSEKVDVAKLNSCVSDKNRGLAYAKKDFDLSAKNNITGSPTLMLNGAQVSEFDFGGRTSDAIKEIICASSKNQENFCSKKLNTDQAATSFSLTYAGAGTSANNSTNCSVK